MLFSGCETLTLGTNSFCNKFQNAPPVHYYPTDSEREKQEKDIIVAYWVTRCTDMSVINEPVI